MSEQRYIYRTGRSWGVTIVRETCDGSEANRLMATAQTKEDANLICAALNSFDKAVEA